MLLFFYFSHWWLVLLPHMCLFFQSEIFLGQFEIWNEMEIKRQTIILAAMMLFDEDEISNMDTEETSDLKKESYFFQNCSPTIRISFCPSLQQDSRNKIQKLMIMNKSYFKLDYCQNWKFSFQISFLDFTSNLRGWTVSALLSGHQPWQRITAYWKNRKNRMSMLIKTMMILSVDNYCYDMTLYN